MHFLMVFMADFCTYYIKSLKFAIKMVYNREKMSIFADY